MDRYQMAREFTMVLAAKRVRECKSLVGLQELCIHLLEVNAQQAACIRQIKLQEIPEFTSDR